MYTHLVSVFLAFSFLSEECVRSLVLKRLNSSYGPSLFQTDEAVIGCGDRLEIAFEDDFLSYAKYNIPLMEFTDGEVLRSDSMEVTFPQNFQEQIVESMRLQVEEKGQQVRSQTIQRIISQK